jgi:hypothetical protein
MVDPGAACVITSAWNAARARRFDSTASIALT